MKLAMLLIVAAVGGCATTPPPDRDAAMYAMLERADKVCRASGHRDGTEPYKNCVLGLYRDMEAERQRVSAMLYQDQMETLRSRKPLYLPPIQPIRQPLTCTTWGNTTTCQ